MNQNLDEKIQNLGNIIEKNLGLNVPYFNEKQSQFFKNYYKVPKNKEFMLTESEAFR